MYEAAKDIFIPVASILFSVVVAYFTAIYAIRRESSHGRLRLLELVRRYFINIVAAYDPITRQINKDEISKKMYVEEMKAILQELQALAANPYFAALISRYPHFSKLLVQLRREIVVNDAPQASTLRNGTITEFWQLHQILSKELPKITKSEVDSQIIDLVREFKLKGVE